MKTKKLTPRNSAPVKRSNVATVAHDSNVIAAARFVIGTPGTPFAGDEAE